MKLSPQGRDLAVKMADRLGEGIPLEDVGLEFALDPEHVTFLTEMLKLERERG